MKRRNTRNNKIQYGKSFRYGSSEAAIKDLTRLAKRQQGAKATPAVGLSTCRGCGSVPIEVGCFGRYKYACPLYVAHSPEATKDCERPDSYRSCKGATDAAVLWNSMQGERTVEG